jgi:hypothetical protein
MLWVAYVAAATFGGFVGVAELLPRYRDEPWGALKTGPGWLYVGINATVAAAGYAIARVFDWKFGLPATADSPKVQATQLIVTGFGSMTILRSTVLTFRIGSREVGVGFNAIVQAFLQTADDAVDRRGAVHRSKAVKMMESVSFAKAVTILPAHCLALMQNLSQDYQDSLGRRVEEIGKLATDEIEKIRLLGLAIINLMGEDVLVTAVETLRDQITVKN